MEDITFPPLSFRKILLFLILGLMFKTGAATELLNLGDHKKITFCWKK